MNEECWAGQIAQSKMGWPAFVLRSNTLDVVAVEKINGLIMYWRLPCSDSRVL